MISQSEERKGERTVEEEWKVKRLIEIRQVEQT